MAQHLINPLNAVNSRVNKKYCSGDESGKEQVNASTLELSSTHNSRPKAHIITASFSHKISIVIWALKVSLPYITKRTRTNHSKKTNKTKNISSTWLACGQPEGTKVEYVMYLTPTDLPDTTSAHYKNVGLLATVCSSFHRRSQTALSNIHFQPSVHPSTKQSECMVEMSRHSHFHLEGNGMYWTGPSAYTDRNGPGILPVQATQSQVKQSDPQDGVWELNRVVSWLVFGSELKSGWSYCLSLDGIRVLFNPLLPQSTQRGTRGYN